MQSLTINSDDASFGDAPVERDRLILPRYLRRPLRFLARLELMTPRHAGLKGATMLLLATGAAGVVMGGHIGPVIASVTSDAGMSISQVRISGQSETAELDVLHALGIGDSTSLATFNVEAARDRVEALPWVKQAQIRKLYPAGLNVEIAEREAFALWRRGDRVSIIDREGIVLGDYLDDRFASLPLVVGDGASMRAGEVVDLLDKVPSIRSRVKAAALVSDRRWNLVLANGAQILLPEDGTEAALKKVVALDAKSQIFNRDVARVDLRLADRVIIGLTPEGVIARKAALAERAKAAKKANPA